MRKLYSITLLAFCFVSIQTTTIDTYVDPVSGNNANQGSSSGTALKTIDQAFKIMSVNSDKSGIQKILLMGTEPNDFTGTLTFLQGDKNCKNLPSTFTINDCIIYSQIILMPESPSPAMSTINLPNLQNSKKCINICNQWTLTRIKFIETEQVPPVPNDYSNSIGLSFRIRNLKSFEPFNGLTVDTVIFDKITAYKYGLFSIDQIYNPIIENKEIVMKITKTNFTNLNFTYLIRSHEDSELKHYKINLIINNCIFDNLMEMKRVIYVYVKSFNFTDNIFENFVAKKYDVSIELIYLKSEETGYLTNNTFQNISSTQILLQITNVAAEYSTIQLDKNRFINNVLPIVINIFGHDRKMRYSESNSVYAGNNFITLQNTYAFSYSTLYSLQMVNISITNNMFESTLIGFYGTWSDTFEITKLRLIGNSFTGTNQAEKTYQFITFREVGESPSSGYKTALIDQIELSNNNLDQLNPIFQMIGSFILFQNATINNNGKFFQQQDQWLAQSSGIEISWKDTVFNGTNKILSASNAEVTIMNVKILNTQGIQFSLFKSTVHIDQLVIKQTQRLLQKASYIEMTRCSFTIANSIFIGGKSRSGGAISNTINQQDGKNLITNTIFRGNSAEFGGAIYTIGGIVIDNCTFSNNIATEKGSDIDFIASFQTNNNMSITNSKFEQVYGLAVYLSCIQESVIKLQSSTFTQSNLTTSLFQPKSSNNPYNYFVSTFFIAQCGKTMINDVIWQNISGSFGSAIYIANLQNQDSGSLKLDIMNSKFRNLKGWTGAAIYSTGKIELTFTKSEFINNWVPMKRLKQGDAELTYVYNEKEFLKGLEFIKPDHKQYYIETILRGATVFYDCNNHTDCNLVIDNNVFTNNTARYGAVYYASNGVNGTLSQIKQTNSFEQNQAFYGPEVASYPVALSIDNNDSKCLNISENNTATWIIYASTGVPLGHNKVFMFDIQGQQFKTTELIKITLDTSQEMYKHSCFNKPKSQFLHYEVSTNESVIDFENQTFVCLKNTSKGNLTQPFLEFNLSSTIFSHFQQERTNPNFYFDSYGLFNITTIRIQFKDCQKGAQLIIEGVNIGKCAFCSANVFASYINQFGCQPCVSGIKCQGGYDTTLLKGYWNLRQYHSLRHNSTTFIKCPAGQACLQNKSIYEDYQCSKYYKGNVCNECKLGYSYVDFIGAKCSDCIKWLYLHFLSFATYYLMFALYILLLVYSFNRQSADIKDALEDIKNDKKFFSEQTINRSEIIARRTKGIESVSVFKLFIQILIVLKILYKTGVCRYEMWYPDYQVDVDYDNIPWWKFLAYYATHKCIYQTALPFMDFLNNLQVIVFTDGLTPILCFLVIIFVFYVYHKVRLYWVSKLDVEQQTQKLWRDMFLIYIAFIFVFADQITSQFLNLGVWQNLGQRFFEGYQFYVVYGAFDLNYFSKEHLLTFLCSYILFVGMFLAPLIVIRRKLRDLVEKVKHGAYNPNVVSNYGFLTIAYEPRYYYWDFHILTRDFILNCVVTFFPVSSAQEYRVIIIGLVFAVFFYYYQLQVRSWPYNNSNLNVLERNLYLLAGVCLSCCIVIEGNVHKYVNLFLIITIAALILIFLIWFFKRYVFDLCLRYWGDFGEAKLEVFSEHLQCLNANVPSNLLFALSDQISAGHFERRKWVEIEMANVSKPNELCQGGNANKKSNIPFTFSNLIVDHLQEKSLEEIEIVALSKTNIMKMEVHLEERKQKEIQIQDQSKSLGHLQGNNIKETCNIFQMHFPIYLDHREGERTLKNIEFPDFQATNVNKTHNHHEESNQKEIEIIDFQKSTELSQGVNIDEANDHEEGRRQMEIKELKNT